MRELAQLFKFIITAVAVLVGLYMILMAVIVVNLLSHRGF